MNINSDNEKINTYDKLIFVLIVFQIFGIIGDAFQPIRLLTILFVPFLISSIIKNSFTFNKYRFEILFYFIWIIYGIITLAFSIHFDESIKELIYLLINFFTVILLLFLSTKANNPKKVIIFSWVLLFAISLPFALYELNYDVHLPTSAQEEGLIMKYDSVIFDRKFASVTFGNLNGYNTVLMLILPFLLGLMFEIKSKFSKVLLWTLIIMFFYIVINNGSRAAIICSFIIISIFFYYYYNKKNVIIVLSTAFLVIFYLINRFSDDLFFVILNRFESQGLSDDGRADILSFSFKEFFNSYTLGIGAGNLKPILAEKYNLENFAPHNLFIEIGAQYGIIILTLFVVQLFKIYKLYKKNNIVSNRYIVFSSLVTFPLVTMIDSSYILSSNIWIFIGSLYIISDLIYNKIEVDG